MASPYDCMDVNEASEYARNHSELPPLGADLDYADGIDDESAYHDLLRRLREQGLALVDIGGGYEVQAYRRE